MKISSHKSPQFTRRAFLLATTSLMAMGALAARLYYLQFIRADDYKTLAEGNSVKLQLIPPLRGAILDRRGRSMADNNKNFRVFIEDAPQDVLNQTLDKLQTLLELEPQRKEKIIESARVSRFAPPILVKEFLEWDKLALVEYHASELPGVFIDVGQVRNYPLSDQAAHLIGYMGAVAEDDLTDQPLLRLPDFKIGKDGLEKTLENSLRGNAGVKHMEVNVHGVNVRELATKPSVPGEDTKTTIDIRLQQYAVQLLGEESGAVVLLEVPSGEVLTLASVPAYDPNAFSKGITTNYWKELNANNKNPLLNKAIAGQYPPGSTFKMLVGLAALQENVASASQTVYCPGHFFLGNHQFNCWKAGGHGTVNLRTAIAQSCDTYFYTMAQRLGIDPIAHMARLFGLGQNLGIELPGEKSGVIPDDKWKRKTYKDPWRPGDTVNAGIGQGYVLATPLQLAVMTARIASGGMNIQPRLLPAENSDSPPPIGVDPQHVRDIQEGMIAVTNEPFGTAYGKRIMEPQFAMAGKTGTSQVRRITQRGVRQESLPWEFRHHALFVGYAPTVNPRLAVSVLVEHGGGGAAAAAPIAREMLLKAQQLAVNDFIGPPLPPLLQKEPQ